MKFSIQKNGFLGTNQGVNFQVPYHKAKAVVIPFGLENTVSYGRGTKKGPKAIIEASHYMEIMDEQALKPFCNCGITTLKEPKIPKNNKEAIDLLAKITRQVVADNKFPVILGGEHSLTQGSIKGLSAKYKNFTVLHFDAHGDTRLNYYLGSEFSHGAVMSQVLMKYPIARLAQVGIRSISDRDGEPRFRQQYQNKIKTFWAWERIAPMDVVRAIPTKNVFISFDVDVFDPGIMPSTGTPEPGGLLWWPIVEILKAVFKSKNIIGADIVELAPIKGLRHPDFMVAKLAYKMIGYKFS
ncbi:MAG: agmatinase [Candidatus Doudnabacteria bacterium]|nr:agmatinase [Candidatus Doudnabacteria bacterium]